MTWVNDPVAIRESKGVISCKDFAPFFFSPNHAERVAGLYRSHFCILQ